MVKRGVELIKIDKLTKIYNEGQNNEIKVLNNISLSIKDGDFMCIMGRSGSGKTTLLHILAGLDTPSDGSILFNGTDISQFNPRQLAKYRNSSIGIVFQNFNLIEELSLIENVMMPLYFIKIKHKDRVNRAIEAIKKVGLYEKIKQKAGILSGGEKQRVSIARAIINNPKILFADEPTGSLDKANEEKIMDLLKNINKRGVTVVMVTHNQELVYDTSKIFHLDKININKKEIKK